MIFALIFLAAAGMPANIKSLQSIKRNIAVTEKKIQYENKKVTNHKYILYKLQKRIKKHRKLILQKNRFYKKLSGKIRNAKTDERILNKLKQKATNETKASLRQLYIHLFDDKPSSNELVINKITTLYFLYKDRIVKKLGRLEKERRVYSNSLSDSKRRVALIKYKISKRVRAERVAEAIHKRAVIYELKDIKELKRKKIAFVRKKSYLERIIRHLSKRERRVKSNKIRVGKIRAVKINRGNPFLRYRKRLFMPVSGTVEKKFGLYKDKKYNVYTKQTGIDIKAKYGSDVSASARGKVVYAGILEGYGKTVIIRHMGNFFTIYGRLKTLKIKKGEFVRTKHIIGTAGIQPIYFGIRYKDKAVDPEKWLRR